MDFENRFAEAILEAQRIREESYDHPASDHAEKAKGNKLIDYDKFYLKTYREAADEAAERVGFDLRMTQPIYLLIKYTWNDIQDWAKEILKDEDDLTLGGILRDALHEDLKTTEYIVNGKKYRKIEKHEKIKKGGMMSWGEGELIPIQNLKAIGLTPADFSYARKFYNPI